MAEQFFCCFGRPDFYTAATEMLQLYLPGAELTKLSDVEWRTGNFPSSAAGVLLEGYVRTEGEGIVCMASLHRMYEGQPISLQQKRTVKLLPWESSTSAERRGMRLVVNGLLKNYYQASASPWGILRGIRPIKLVHRLLDIREPITHIREVLREAYDVEDGKAALLTNVAIRQRPFLLNKADARQLVSVYIGIPFCPSRCAYCSFPALPITGAGQLVEDFLVALRREIEMLQQFLVRHDLKVQTIYIGGGTPTSLSDQQFRQLLADVCQAFSGNCLREFTVEAGRPDTITPDKLAIMREHSVTRISINPQTMREHTLQVIGRSHRPVDVERVFSLARQSGFTNINMDLIAGLPGETPEDMQYTLARLGDLQPDNLTVHTLAIKRGSSIKDNTGFSLPSASIVRTMLELCAAQTRDWGLSPYYLYRQKYMAGNMENIGYALPGKECIYNIQIIEERQTIVGLGAAASTKVVDPGGWQILSCYNPKDVPTYLRELQSYLTRKLTLLQGVFDNKEE